MNVEDGDIVAPLVTVLVAPLAFFGGLAWVNTLVEGVFLLTVTATIFFVAALYEFTDPGVPDSDSGS